ncbi:hypothetical protein [Rufibacter sp. LB8]|uniref:hypothetical protein n=1 Tax=Rufibacter sp. LB8 TaxID=2777781 RepID=UPI00178C6D71|nr:hypothetical protein [Rufibacter sp. LB8]
MSQEHFDHKIKKKLESVRPPFREEAWQKFKHLLPMPWYLLFLKKYGGYAYAGITTAALVATTYFYLQERSENDLLKQNLATLQTTAAEQNSGTQPVLANQPTAPSFKIDPTLPNQPLARAEAFSKTDTVYLVQKIYVDRPVFVKDRHKTESSTAQDGHISTAIMRQTGKVSEGTGPTISPGSQASAKNINNMTVVTTTGSSGSSRASAERQIQDTATTGQSESTALSTISRPDNKANLPLSPDTTRHVNRADTVATAAAAMTDKPSGSSFTFPALHARFGIAADAVGFQRLAFGPTAELYLGERLSVGAGLQFSAPFIESLGDPKEFNRKKGRRFEDEYRDRIPRNDRIEGIQLTTQLVRLPLSLQYYFPTNGNLSFMVMGGTNLDISVQQRVDFKSSFQGKQEFNRFNKKPAPNTFNNVLYGVGLQYTFGKWVGQLMPYYNYQLSEPAYRDSTPKVGISATIKLDISK